jgi:sporulation protein YlmC with PRC-barrel domain
MLIKAKAMRNYKLHALDGEIGKVREFCFDDHYWTIRYLIADTGEWLEKKQVLISPHALLAANKDERDIKINLSKKQITESPSPSSDEPVSRQFEESYHAYYGWEPYWTGAYAWGSSPYIMGNQGNQKETNSDGKAWDYHLRSTSEVSGYKIHATDGEIGHIEDFVIDDETWTIRYLIVDTKNWWPGKRVLLSPKWIKSVSWEESKIFVDLPREKIKQAPEYSDKTLLNRDFEDGLHRHYGRHGYWVD